jgi:capsular exopolysaccharide synthesis family protein
MNADFKDLTGLASNGSERGRAVIRARDAASSPSAASAALASGPVIPAGPSIEWNPPESFEPANTESIGLDEIFSRLWRRRIALLFLAFLGVAAAAVISAMRPPVYRARTAIRLEGLDDGYRNLGDAPPFGSTAANAPTEAYLQNELKILQSETLAKRVADRLGLQTAQNPPSFLRSPFGISLGRTPSPDDLRIKTVEKSLTIRSSLKSQVVEILFDSPDPALAARGANTVVSEYVAINREARLETVQDTTEWLGGQIADLKAKLDHGNDELQAFARSAGLLYAADQSSLTEQSVREVEEQLSKAHAERTAKESRYETAISNSPESLPNAADSGLLREYEGKLAALQGELTQLQSLYTPSHYKVLDVKARIAQLESAIKGERQHIIDRMRAEYQSADRVERALESTYRGGTRKLETETADAFHYNVLKRELDSTQQLYNSLLQRTKEAGVASALHATSIRIIDAARVPSIPYSPNLPLNCAMGLCGGLVFGVGLVLVRERGGCRVERGSDSRIANLRELGAIPSAKHDPALRASRNRLLASTCKEGAIELVTRYKQPSLLAESFRATLASIRFSPGFERTHGVLAVTSVQPQEGKTTTAINLGIALTETHGRVLLIDADLRRPRLHKVFEHGNATGLTSMLTSDEPITDINFDALIHATSVPGLSMLPSGPCAANVTPLLYSLRMSEFLARARKEFDYVLIDTPPTALFSDARIIGKLSDSVVVVVHAAKTNRGEFNAACLHFLEDGTHILGTILNHWDVNVRRGSYESYSYR